MKIVASKKTFLVVIAAVAITAIVGSRLLMQTGNYFQDNYRPASNIGA